MDPTARPWAWSRAAPEVPISPRVALFRYCAHKLALLYHAVNLSKVRRDALRRRIEEHFQDVKGATESTEAPQMGPELVRWVVALCDEVAATVREVPPSIVSMLEPLLPLLQPAQSGRYSQSGRSSVGGGPAHSGSSSAGSLSPAESRRLEGPQ